MKLVQKRTVLVFLLIHQEFVDGGSGTLAGAHRGDDGGSACDGIAAGVDSIARGFARILFYDKTAAAIDQKPLGGFTN